MSLVLCPGCGSNRLLPLTFDIFEVDEILGQPPVAVLERPVVKCVGCGRRIVGHEIVKTRGQAETATGSHRL